MPTICLDRCDLFYEKVGSGDTSLLFLHGAFCSHRDWHLQVDALRSQFTVVTLDLRCHGASAAAYESFGIKQLAADVHALIDTLSLREPLLIGHSLGARVALQAAADRPAALSGIVLVEGSRLVPGLSAPLIRLALDRKRRRDPRSQIAEAFESMFFENAIPEEKDRILRVANATPVAGMRAIGQAVALWDAFGLTHALRKLPSRLPVFAIQSTHHDHATKRLPLSKGTISTPWLDLLRSRIPSLRTLVIPSAGHFTMIEAPQQVAEAIRHFVAAMSRFPRRLELPT